MINHSFSTLKMQNAKTNIHRYAARMYIFVFKPRKRLRVKKRIIRKETKIQINHIVFLVFSYPITVLYLYSVSIAFFSFIFYKQSRYIYLTAYIRYTITYKICFYELML